MRRLFWRVLFFIFKPVICLLVFAYSIKRFSYRVIISFGLLPLTLGLVYNSHFCFFIASIMLFFLLLLFLFDIFMNKDKILMKMRKGVIIDETPYNKLDNNDNLHNKEDYENEEYNDEDNVNNDVNDYDTNTDALASLSLFLIEQISGFWFWVLVYGIYAYFVQKDLLPFKISFVMLVINIIFALKNNKFIKKLMNYEFIKVSKKFLDKGENVVYRSKISKFAYLSYFFICYYFFTNSYVLLKLFRVFKTDFLIGLLALIIILILLVFSLLSIIDMLTKRFWLTNKNLIITYFFKTYKIPINEISDISFDRVVIGIFYVSILKIQTKTNKNFRILGTTCIDVSDVFEDLTKSSNKQLD